MSYIRLIRRGSQRAGPCGTAAVTRDVTARLRAILLTRRGRHPVPPHPPVTLCSQSAMQLISARRFRAAARRPDGN